MALFAEFNTSHLFLLGLLATSGAMLFHAQRRMRLSMTPSPTHGRKVRDRPQRRDRSGAATDELRAWESQMHDFAQDVSARIDAKLAALEQLNRAARHEAQRLEEAIAQAKSLSFPQRSAAAQGIEEPAPRGNQAQALEAAARAFDRPAPLPPPKMKLAPERPVAKIHALADTGLEVRDIAERVGAPVGEVELILGLRGVQ